jgi:hypothetical protein
MLGKVSLQFDLLPGSLQQDSCVQVSQTEDELDKGAYQ